MSLYRSAGRMPALARCLAPLALLLGLAATPARADLFVSSSFSDQVLEYNGTTGAFVSAFVAAGSGGLIGPASLVFGPNGDLFVSSFSTDQVLEYNGTTGAFVSAFVAVGSGGLIGPTFLTFSPTVVPVPVPEPGSVVLACLGGLLLLVWVCRARWCCLASGS